MISGVLSSVLALTSPTVLQNTETNLPVIYVETVAWSGEFTVRVRPEGRENTSLVLVGTILMDDLPKDGRFDAMIKLTVPVVSFSVRHAHDFVLVTLDDRKDVYRISSQQDGSEIWEGMRDVSSGSITVIQSETPMLQVSSHHIAQLFDALVETHGLRTGACSPTYATCLADAKALCTHGVGSFHYECNQTTKAAVCDWDCLQPAPGS
jgi:hypothetical protein